MLSITCIVVASDLAKQSTLALQRAVRLKKQLGVNLTLLHVLDGAAEPARTEERRQGAKELLQAQVRSVCKDETHHLWLKVVEGERDTTIIAEAEELGADLLILGDGRKRCWYDNGTYSSLESVSGSGGATTGR
jgi:nucleotide-binding universal stress UspA family protein